MAKILLVEDERNIASFIERGLHEFGHTVSVTHDGTTAWELLQHEAFDLLVLDIIMPGINGLDLCRQYRQKEGYQTPVIMLTALGTTEDIVKGLDAGADDYLVKPFSFQELEARIKALLRRGRETPALQLTCNDLVLDCNTPPRPTRRDQHRPYRKGISPAGILHDPSRRCPFPSHLAKRRVGQELRYQHQRGRCLRELSEKQDRQGFRHETHSHCCGNGLYHGYPVTDKKKKHSV